MTRIKGTKTIDPELNIYIVLPNTKMNAIGDRKEQAAPIVP